MSLTAFLLWSNFRMQNQVNKNIYHSPRVEEVAVEVVVDTERGMGEELLGARRGTREVFVGGFFEKVGFEDYFSLSPLGMFFEEVVCPGVELGFGGGIVAGER